MTWSDFIDKHPALFVFLVLVASDAVSEVLVAVINVVIVLVRGGK